jgi:hypothetical protein
MTMPHLMNCRHSEDGWCLDCVKEQWGELGLARQERDYVAKLAGIVCHRCSAKDNCPVAFDGYNVDVEPQIDCLGAK